MNKLKRKWANRNPWPRILKQRFAAKSVSQCDYQGYVTVLCLDEVSSPLWMKWQDQALCIADSGYTWLQQFPIGTQYTMTTQFDAQGQVVQWYIDICAQHGVGEDGIPWWDDLFLDIIIFPSGECEIIDGADLDAALQNGIVDEFQHCQAWAEATRLVKMIEQSNFGLLALSLSHRTELLAFLSKNPIV